MSDINNMERAKLKTMASEIKHFFEGKWAVYESDNFEKYLDKLDLGFLKKKLMLTLKPTMTVTVEGDTISVTMAAGPKTNKSSYKLDTEFETHGEFPSMAVASFCDGKWVTEGTPKDSKKGKKTTITREIVDGKLVQTMTVEDVSCKRYFKRV